MAEEQHAVLMRHLRNAQQFTRPPKRLRQAFKTTSELKTHEREDTSRIFLEAGFRAWLAYFLATNAIGGTCHYQGKANDVAVISNVQKKSSEEKRILALGVCKEGLDSASDERVKSWENHCGYHHWLQNQQAMANVNSDSSGEVGNLDENNSPSQGAEVLIDSQHGVNQENQGQFLQATIVPHDSTLFPEATLVQQMPSATIAGVMELFPPYICGAILKDRTLNVAMVQMSFPRFPSDDCLMTLTIQPNKVEYLAMALFGIHLESEGEHRYVVMENGARVVPSNEMSLEGAEESALASTFGPLISTAIQNSWKRTLEIGGAIRKTRCVSMDVSMKSSVPACLSLWLRLEKGLEMRQILYV
ncbi:hypothetical protein E5D57_003584 [Metarhizium anisopliae]|nr:hypothetical protein E5D57_003584 [Metarhizium anisopliae]